MSPHTRPRPILKHHVSMSKQVTQPLPFLACGHPVHSPHVHFPPTPGLVQSTHPAHSPRTYDRRPIIVSPNQCDLSSRSDRKLHSPPADFEVERPGRSRTRSPGRAAEDVKGSYFHPRAFEACEPEPLASDIVPLTPPPLVTRRASFASDSESESETDGSAEDSDDSDAVTTPPDLKPSVALPEAYTSPSSSFSRAAGLPRDSLLAEKQRPHLVRADDQPSIIPLREYTITIVDEGCLGGF